MSQQRATRKILSSKRKSHFSHVKITHDLFSHLMLSIIIFSSSQLFSVHLGDRIKASVNLFSYFSRLLEKYFHPFADKFVIIFREWKSN
jgi:hypothetical protein